jgi:hypothetical protein
MEKIMTIKVTLRIRDVLFRIPNPNFFYSGNRIRNIIVSGWWNCLQHAKKEQIEQ